MAFAVKGRIGSIGIFGIAMATLMQQIMITRLFSATMYYHFAFAIVSLTMLGLTIGALAVFLYRNRFPYPGDAENLAFFSAFFGMFSTIAVLLQTTLTFLSSPTNIGLIANLLLFLPGFICSGIVITMLLTQKTGNVSRLYASDLCGAALGCLLTLWTLDLFGGINGLLISACIPAAVALMFACATPNRLLQQRMAGFVIFIAGIMAINMVLTFLHQPLFSVMHAKGHDWENPEQEFWNSYSRVTFYDMGEIRVGLSSAGLGYGFPDYKAAFKKIFIDSTAATVMMKYTGKHEEIDFLNYDITNSAYRMRKVGSVAIIGTGGGRDILSALAGGARHILGIEMNSNIIHLLADIYCDFAGLCDDPRITLVNDEGRSYLLRQNRQFDLIQLSMIDTWAATAAGAFSLSENGLYTVEAWRGFFSRLTPGGMLSLTRWYVPNHFKDELYRLMALARAVLLAEGIADPRRHVAVINSNTSRFASVIISRSPISEKEIQNLTRFAEARKFTMLLSPYDSANDDLTAILSSDAPVLPPSVQTVDLSAPYDDRPFFFNTSGFWQSIKTILTPSSEQRAAQKDVGMIAMNVRATEMLLYIFGCVLALTVLLIVFPLWRHESRVELTLHNAPYLAYFAMLGLGFMCIEVAQMQRLMIFLGHPTYALVVVLCSLLVSSGAGSFATERIGLARAGRFLVALCAVLILVGAVTVPLLHYYRGDPTMVRISIALLTLIPAGFFMGMGFPFGMKLADRNGRMALTPWFWGVNGATSVLASVLALIVAMFNGISTAYWCGTACYLLAAALFHRISRRTTAAVQ